MTDDARIDRIRGEMSDALAALPDPGLEGAPTVRAQQAERRRIAQAQIDEINVTRASVAKFTTRIERARTTRAIVLDTIADCERRSAASAAVAEQRARLAGADRERSAAAATMDVESLAWLEGARYLRGDIAAYERPGALIAMERELRIDHLPTLPTCDEQLAQAERDLQPHLEHLRGALDVWERREIVTANMTTDLPAMQSHATATAEVR